MGGRWVVTVHDEELPFLDAFREQDKGETLIGALSPAALVASLLDWHLTTYFEADRDQHRPSRRGAADPFGQTHSARGSSPCGAAYRTCGGCSRRSGRCSTACRVRTSAMWSNPRRRNTIALFERRFERAVDSVDHARDLVNGSFQLFTSRTAESTNDLVRRLTFITMLLGAVGAVAGIFGMNFEVPFFQSGGLGFWSVIGVLILFTIAAMAVARMRNWI